MAIFNKQTFTKQTVNLDDNVYKDCKFHECVLIYSGGPLPILHDNDIVDCIWSMAGAADRTVTFMMALYHGGAKELVETIITSIRNPPEMAGAMYKIPDTPKKGDGAKSP